MNTDTARTATTSERSRDLPARLIVLRNLPAPLTDAAQAEVAALGELRGRGLLRLLARHALRYRCVEMHTYDVRVVTRPLACSLLLRMLSRGSCAFVDTKRGRQAMGAGWILRRLVRWGIDLLCMPVVRAGIPRTIERLRADRATGRRVLATGGPLYLRTDMWFGVRSGGSIGHVAGVLNNLVHFAGRPSLVTSDELPLIAAEIPVQVVTPPDRFRDFPELWAYYYGLALAADLQKTRPRPAFIYQRYSHNNLCGLLLARHWQVPLVIEYNGSEVWMQRHWGQALRHADIAERVETANMELADLVVVVSEASRAELQSRRLRIRHMLVNPNGVDPQIYHPQVDGTEVRRRRQLGDAWTFGFIGTFGRWHGAEVLAEAFALLLKRRPEARPALRLLLIGDGLTMPIVKRLVAERAIQKEVVFAGLVPQQEGPAHLAACDVLVSPHVPNPDGTAFFGSPTKLFEYMAMGRPIVASDLDQVGSVLQDGSTAILVAPGDAQALSEGMERTMDDPPRARAMGANARREVLARYTWKAHTQRIVAELSVATTGSPGSNP